ncbi:MAG: hypothetical protein M1835_007315 [Candelina submexicana]|nr:MAG: hypothetical protein M1835_007315 [Candelina submexicana]
MTCNITHTPHLPEPLPLYTRDPDETASICSSAPSYTSEAPSYHSYTPQRPALHTRSITLATTTSSSAAPPTIDGRPTPRFAPGFRHGSQCTISDVEAHTYNIASWSSVTSGHQARHYQNVANRRATLASAESERQAVAAAVLSPTNNKNAGVFLGVLEEEQHEAEEDDDDEDIKNMRPNEDPALVGEEAARKAKMRRRYLERCRGEEVLQRENKSWDFMLGQMADWKEREKSWNQFREEAVFNRSLGRRLGLRRKGV